MVGGCAGAGARLFPAAPVESRESAGGIERLYDLDGDARPEWTEQLSPSGQVMLLRYSPGRAGGGGGGRELARAGGGGWEAVWPPAPDADVRHLVVIVDSVPYEMVRELWDQGRFRLFRPPTRVVSPFPVMTDLTMAEFFGVSPSNGVESHYYDGRRMTQGYFTYAAEATSGWLADVDYHLPYLQHGSVYLDPRPWYAGELGSIQRLFERGRDPLTVGYLVSTSALGARLGRDGHQEGLVQLDRFCQSMVQGSGGRVHITLLSDHGHDLVLSRRVLLQTALTNFGYRNSGTLERPGDVIVPEFGAVTCAAVYTHSPGEVARDLAGLEGVQLTMYAAGEEVIVLSAGGRARISAEDGRYRYVCDFGDPLELRPIAERLQAEGALDRRGYAADGVWWDATSDHRYPDPLHRIWRAFHGLTRHTPDVLISIEDGWDCGSWLMTHAFPMASAHGNLGWRSTNGFCLTTAGELPAVVRMEDLAAALRKAGAPLPQRLGPGGEGQP